LYGKFNKKSSIDQVIIFFICI